MAVRLRQDFVQAGDVRLQYFEHGTGPQAVVLVHGYTASARIWAKFQPVFDDALFRSIAISNCGAGDSGRGVGPDDYTIQAFAADLYNAITALGLKDIILVGHSLGGGTAAQFALDHPELLRALVLLNPVPLDHDGWWPGWQEQLHAMFDATQKPQTPATNDFDRAMQEDAMRNPIERRDGSIASMAALKLRQRLGELAMPVIVIGGDRDTLVGVENILDEYRALPAATRSLHMYHGVGHSPNMEVPELLAGTIRSFVQGLEQR